HTRMISLFPYPTLLRSGSHRARRKKEMVKSPLDEIIGVGPTRKRALLLHFGTAKAVSRAAVEDLMQVDGISETVARTIYDHLHEDRKSTRLNSSHVKIT